MAGIIVGAIAGIGSYLDSNKIIIIFCALTMIDYLLGIILAFTQGNWNKQKNLNGMLKKLGYIICSILGFVLDYTANQLGFDIDTKGICGVAITSYLIGAEGLSIIKSLSALGIPVPSYITKGFQHIVEEENQNAN